MLQTGTADMTSSERTEIKMPHHKRDCIMSLTHLREDNFDIWVAECDFCFPNKEETDQTYSLIAFSTKDLAAAFLTWLGGIARESDEHEQSCFGILHAIDQLFPPEMIEQIRQNSGIKYSYR
jgi:hypothetical protein